MALAWKELLGGGSFGAIVVGLIQLTGRPVPAPDPARTPSEACNIGKIDGHLSAKIGIKPGEKPI